MAKLPYPIYGLENLRLFRCFQTRTEYQEATGITPPAFDPRRPPKYWFDPKAKDSPRRNIVYDNVIAMGTGSAALVGPDGKPMMEAMVLSKDEAGQVNIPWGTGGEEGADQPAVPVPLRALEPGEELFFQLGGVVAVKNVELFDGMKEGYTSSDRALMQAIARKLGIF